MLLTFKEVIMAKMLKIHKMLSLSRLMVNKLFPGTSSYFAVKVIIY